MRAAALFFFGFLPLFVSAAPKVFQPGEVIRADEINQNFQEIYNLAGRGGHSSPQLFWAYSGRSIYFPASERMLPLECPDGAWGLRSLSTVHLIADVCVGDCNVQIFQETCLVSSRLYRASGTEQAQQIVIDGAEPTWDPSLWLKVVEPPTTTVELTCQKLGSPLSDGDICDPEDTASWKVLASRRKSSTLITLWQNQWDAEPPIIKYSGVTFEELKDRQYFEINGKSVIIPERLKGYWQMREQGLCDTEVSPESPSKCYYSGYAEGTVTEHRGEEDHDEDEEHGSHSE